MDSCSLSSIQIKLYLTNYIWYGRDLKSILHCFALPLFIEMYAETKRCLITYTGHEMFSNCRQLQKGDNLLIIIYV
jgi:hypothetical protein